MDWIQLMLNLTVPPMAIVFLSVVLPPLALMRMLSWSYHLIFRENMRGKTVLITGASSGIGEQMAYCYAKKGANLMLVARREERLKAVADKSRSLGAKNVNVIAADVTKEEDCKRFIDETINLYGCLDHLVNNAAIAGSFLFEEANTSAFPHVMDVTFWGNVYPTYYALPHLKRSSGRIVVTASAAGWLPMPRMSIYNAGKAAVINFYDSLRAEVGSSVSITIATPGWIESEMTMGKFVTKRGEVEVDQETRDVQVGPSSVVSTEGCAKAIVEGACRGKRYVTIPMWYSVIFLYRIFAPELLQWVFYIFFVKKTSTPGRKQQQPLTKAALDATGAKKLLYPSSIQSQPQSQSQSQSPRSTKSD